jgi:L-fucose isomerase-like protein
MVCRVMKGMRRMTVGAIGARTTAFKTVRFDELTLQKLGITTEVLDMSDVFRRVRKLDLNTDSAKAKAEKLKNYTNFSKVPDKAFDNLVRFGVVIDEIIEEYNLDALAIRCWLEMELEFGVAPCVLLSEINDRGFPAACELDICNAVSMYALQLATGKPTACLDWNNNYGDDPDKCILFHCGNAPESMMTEKGRITDHEILANSVGYGKGFGCNQGRMVPGNFSYGNLATEDGRIKTYLGKGVFTEDPLPENYFGVAGVAEIPQLQDVLQHIGFEGHRHHVALTPGDVCAAASEALLKYLEFDVTTY